VSVVTAVPNAQSSCAQKTAETLKMNSMALDRIGILSGFGPEFLTPSERDRRLGYSIYNRRFAKASAAKFIDLTLNPKATTEKILRRAKSTGRGTRRD
jgi:hypothetical protein